MSNIGKVLIDWYSQHKRNLPWRDTKNPYLIWVSEIILQQTRVDQGLDYYNRFIDTFPNINTLASANIDTVLKIWQGLGYYSRARNMHFTANYIVNELNGKFPKNFNELKKLKGVGDYTAAAIASFAFKEAVPVVDGNVFRFLSRLYGIFESTQTTSGKKVFFEKALEIIDENNPAEFNQAIMEFGAIQCTPANPDCQNCVFNLNCYALNKDKVSSLPIKKEKIKTKNRYFNYIYIIYNENTFIKQRTEKDIWQLLYQFPLIETNKKISDNELLNHPDFIKILKNTNPKIKNSIFEKKHILSHQIIYAKFIKINIQKMNQYLTKNYILTPIDSLKNFSIPRLMDSYLEHVNK